MTDATQSTADRLRGKDATPAPWSVLDGARAPCIRGGLAEDDGGWPVADLEITGRKFLTEEADARLIALLGSVRGELADVVEAAERVAAGAGDGILRNVRAENDLDFALAALDKAVREAQPSPAGGTAKTGEAG